MNSNKSLKLTPERPGGSRGVQTAGVRFALVNRRRSLTLCYLAGILVLLRYGQMALVVGGRLSPTDKVCHLALKFGGLYNLPPKGVTPWEAWTTRR